MFALAVLPFALTGLLVLLSRWGSGAARWPASSAVKPGQLLLLSFIAILSHPILDSLNTYGVRWLMPFSGRWFYGDTLFIVDPWIWLALGLGVYVSRRRERFQLPSPPGPARLALVATTVYLGAMRLSSVSAARIVADQVSSLTAYPVQAAMAGPVLLQPFVREFVTQQETEYRVGTFRWLERPHVNRSELLTFPRGLPAHPAVLPATRSPLGRRFLGWARFPTYEIEQVSSTQYLVHIIDLRYARGPGHRFGAVSIPVSVEAAP